MAQALHVAADEAQQPTPTPAPQADEQAPAEHGPSIFSLPLATLKPTDPFVWLRLGWQDFQRCPRIGLFYGLCFFVMGHALLALFQKAPEYLLALSAGFLLMGPSFAWACTTPARRCRHTTTGLRCAPRSTPGGRPRAPWPSSPACC